MFSLVNNKLTTVENTLEELKSPVTRFFTIHLKL